jgi:hypothetical protein
MVEFSGQEKELFATGLASAIRNYMDEDNETRERALKEIESNEVIINIGHESRK